ncbi:filamentous hemagglutinin N-terminal domain-containing protein, partial [Selenomonas ruminantium]|uniref:two-partner secretion domain-containing protein n=1 Tax=Selenomonas ruminantium TaxID=971 RepID=UPI0026F0D99C
MKRNERLSRKARYGILAAIMAGAFSIMPAAQAMPTGGASETATITTTGNTMDIASSVTNNLLTWQDFSIAKGETVNFGGSNTYLNVVTGNNASEIYGAITGSAANVYLINPNGILFGDGAQVNVGSLHLSTADIKGSLANFDTAKTALDSVATFSGDIVNKGSLTATQEITVDGANITFKNTADISASAVSDVKLKANGDGEIHIGSTAGTRSGYTIAQGTEMDYRLVSTAAELQAINDGLSGNYMLKNDIDMSGVNDFTPLGNNSNNMFTGRFDGVNYTIKNLTINKSDDYSIGLFGYAQNAVIENFGKVGGGVTGSGWASVGAIIGQGEGGITIRNVYNTGTVNNNYSDAWAGAAGGIAGFLNESGNSISQSYNTGNVTNSGRGAGGIVGRICGTSTIDNVYNTGAVAGNDGAGGIVGWYDGNLTLTNAYNTGNVSASSYYAGGIAGVTDGDFGYTQGNINISYTYNTGSITSTGSARCNGIIRQSGGVTVSNSYYTQGGGSYGEEKTAEQLKQASMFSAWGDNLDTNGSSTTAAWRIYEGNTAPLLTAFMTRKDNVVATKIYDGTAPVGYTSATPSTKTSTQAEGINWVSDVTVVSPKVLTISFEPIKKEYDGTTSATVGKGTLSGVVGEDSVSYDV